MGTEFPIPQKYSAWEIRVCVLISLTLQILLIFLAPLRKKKAIRPIQFVTWSCYLLADWIADFALGLLLQSNSPGNGSPQATSTSISLGIVGASTALKHGPTNNTNIATTAIQGSWAPFLLLHLGGPDTITAYALQDNELWLRHFLGLAFELFATIWVLSVSLRHLRLIPIGVIMLLVGVAKYTERTFCLYRGSMDGFRTSMLGTPDPGPNYAKFMEEYDSKKKAGLQTEIFVGGPSQTADAHEKAMGELKGKSKTASAYYFYNIFRYLFVDLILSFNERKISYKYFVDQTPSASDAFKVIEIELNFVYDVLYTKAAVIHTRFGYALRLLSSAGILSAFLVFFFFEKNDFTWLDIAITYALLIGAMALDATALTMLLLSDWTHVFLEGYFPDYRKQLDAVLKWLPMKRWSEKISQMNLIDCCIGKLPEEKGEPPEGKDEPSEKILKGSMGGRVNVEGQPQNSKEQPSNMDSEKGEPPEGMGEPLEKKNFFNPLVQLFSPKRLLSYLAKPVDKLFFSEILTELLYMRRKPVDEKLKEFIFQGCKNKSPEEPDYEKIKKICDLRGARALNLIKKDEPGLHEDIMKTVEVDFDESLLLWHIATELCRSVPKEQIRRNSKTPKREEEENQAEGRKEEGIQKVTQGLEEKQAGGKEEGIQKEGVEEERQARGKKEGIQKKEGVEETDELDVPDLKDISKSLSDYMLYLLVLQPEVLSTTGGIGLIRYQDTCAEARRFFEMKGMDPNHKVACQMLIEVNTEAKPDSVKGDRSKSVLFDACILAKNLSKLPDETVMWRVIAGVWGELLAYAACHCRGMAHAGKLSRGGEFITMVWFLMAHLGLGDLYRIQADHARTKIVVKK